MKLFSFHTLTVITGLSLAFGSMLGAIVAAAPSSTIGSAVLVNADSIDDNWQTFRDETLQLSFSYPAFFGDLFFEVNDYRPGYSSLGIHVHKPRYILRLMEAIDPYLFRGVGAEGDSFDGPVTPLYLLDTIKEPSDLASICDIYSNSFSDIYSNSFLELDTRMYWSSEMISCKVATNTYGVSYAKLIIDRTSDVQGKKSGEYAQYFIFNDHSQYSSLFFSLDSLTISNRQNRVLFSNLSAHERIAISDAIVNSMQPLGRSLSSQERATMHHDDGHTFMYVNSMGEPQISNYRPLLEDTQTMYMLTDENDFVLGDARHGHAIQSTYLSPLPAVTNDSYSTYISSLGDDSFATIVQRTLRYDAAEQTREIMDQQRITQDEQPLQYRYLPTLFGESNLLFMNPNREIAYNFIELLVVPKKNNIPSGFSIPLDVFFLDNIYAIELLYENNRRQVTKR